ncbi:DNA polymerase zeta catalytic subunit [Hypsizygus marmoreus]|uniref:DNA polymerase n=1 Tax=Hypsizygus marmoreus TaxID=39966 RepID=A0A369K1S9_HYPMA|nr:DNA polymerase zeta catalytic subunit [Hypsizygus marmoreus]
MTLSEPPRQPSLRVQINQIDYALVPPGPLDNSSLPRVPVIRIYGPSSVGKKTCLHVHQVYPYFYVEYNGKLTASHVNRYVSMLTRSLNYAIALSLKRNQPDAQYIRAVLLVKGVHFYGFHSSYSPFLKIFIADPAYLSRAVTIMQSGTVMGTRFCVFESHLSYVLQFMCDFGLYGCGWIELGDVLQRDVHSTYAGDYVTPNSNDVNFVSSPYFRQSCMPLEVDAIAPQILNRHRITARNLHQKLEVPSTPRSAEPLILSIRELWEDERKRRIAHGLNPSPELPVDPSDSSRNPGGNWVAEARWWEELRTRIERDASKLLQGERHDWVNWVMSTFESTEALWEEAWRAWRPSNEEARADTTATTGVEPSAEIGFNHDVSVWTDLEEVKEAKEGQIGVDVDMSMLSSQEISQMMELEEAELAGLLDNDDQGAEDDVDPGVDADIFDEEEELDEGSQDSDFPAQGPDSTPDPFQAEHPLIGPPKDFELNLASPPQRPDNYTCSSPVTPTRTNGPATPLVVSASPSEAEPDAEAPGVEYGTQLIDMEVSQLQTSEEDTFGFQGQQHEDNLTYNSQVKGESLRLVPFGEAARPLKRRRVAFSSHDDDLPPEKTFFSSPSPSADFAPRSQTTVMKLLRETYAFRTVKNLNLNRYAYFRPPPQTSQLTGSLNEHGISNKYYQPPFYSLPVDVPQRPREYGGLLYHLKGGEGITDLDPWNPMHHSDQSEVMSPLDPSGLGGWEYASSPPSYKEMRRWLASDAGKLPSQALGPKMKSQIKGPTPINIYGLKSTLNRGTVSSDPIRDRQSMSVLSLEVFVPAREGKVPDPEFDEMVALFYTFQITEGEPYQRGAVVLQAVQLDARRIRGGALDIVANEIDLINRMIDIVVVLDPDILVGWEVQHASWGYIEARGRQHGFELVDLISRATTSHSTRNDQWGMRHTSTFKVAGRHVLNLWRLMRSECTLTSYTFENVVFNVLQRRFPRYSYSTLTEWYHSAVPGHLACAMRYLSDRASMLLEILEKSEVITKTAEFARVFGVDFFSVISRGSQFKVESFMFRLAKPESFVLLSPSKRDVGKQNAAECMPLIMEPMSAFYSSPLVVLDFQSLYPSIMIAYNYCYSTCLGRVKEFQGKNKFGVVDLDLPPGLLASLADHIHVAPNGIIYVKSEVRQGLLGRMLTELLETRVMVKHAMKSVTHDKALRRILEARQLSLKYIANVTYGYTSATYSGRMPAVEIADSIVQSGRETLEKAIMLINATKKWGAEVVYGDTDSIFIYLRGKTKEQAFRIGNEIADTITAMNPSPVKLKFEKVYLPCVLLAKKRYVGFKYEHVDEENGVFDAKGIETVRRDGVPAQQKMTETCLRILFRTKDLSRVKDYCCSSWTKLLEDKSSIQDFIFAKEVRLGTYSEKGPPPPGVAVAARRMLNDPNDEPHYGERVPYVVVRGLPRSRLVDRAMDPLEMVNEGHLQLDAFYYITRVLIPPLERIFNLVGADVRGWFDEMPKARSADPMSSPVKVKGDEETLDRPNIDEHFQSSQCLICGGYASDGLCDDCYFSPQPTIASLSARIQSNEKRLMNAHRICATCTGSGLSDPIKCESLDCPWFFSRKRAENKQGFLAAVEEVVHGLNDDVEGDPLFGIDPYQAGFMDEDEVDMDYMDFLYHTPEH